MPGAHARVELGVYVVRVHLQDVFKMPERNAVTRCSVVTYCQLQGLFVTHCGRAIDLVERVIQVLTLAELGRQTARVGHVALEFLGALAAVVHHAVAGNFIHAVLRGGRCSVFRFGGSKQLGLQFAHLVFKHDLHQAEGFRVGFGGGRSGFWERRHFHGHAHA